LPDNFPHIALRSLEGFTKGKSDGQADSIANGVQQLCAADVDFLVTSVGDIAVGFAVTVGSIGCAINVVVIRIEGLL
jgi:hypothetical protein